MGESAPPREEGRGREEQQIHVPSITELHMHNGHSGKKQWPKFGKRGTLVQKQGP